MSNGTEVTVLRFGWIYNLIGPLFVFLAALFPLLMWWNNESFDATVVASLVAFAVSGVLVFLYSRAYEVRVSDTGFVLSRLWLGEREVPWSRVAAVRLTGSDVIFDTTEGRVVKVSGYLPNIGRLVTSAEERLPESAWRK